MIRVLCVVLMGLAAPAASQVYKCPNASGVIEFTDKPCDGAAEPIRIRETSFGGSARSSEVQLQGTSCVSTASGRYATAAGTVVNHTKEPKRVRLSANFTYRGTVVDVARDVIALQPFARATYSLVGGPGPIDQCGYDYAWD